MVEMLVFAFIAVAIGTFFTDRALNQNNFIE